jgi:nitroreductase
MRRGSAMDNKLNEISLYQAILARRSVREYTLKKVDVKRIRSLIEAAVMAPTAMHSEPWAFAIIQDVAVMKTISDTAKSSMTLNKMHRGFNDQSFNDPAFNVFYDASTLIIICANKNNPTAFADCWMAAENLMLSALAMGLGTCVIGNALLAINEREQKSNLGIDDTYEAIAPIIVGFPNVEAAPRNRKKPLILSWIES